MIGGRKVSFGIVELGDRGVIERVLRTWDLTGDCGADFSFGVLEELDECGDEVALEDFVIDSGSNLFSFSHSNVSNQITSNQPQSQLSPF